MPMRVPVPGTLPHPYCILTRVGLFGVWGFGGAPERVFEL